MQLFGILQAALVSAAAVAMLTISADARTITYWDPETRKHVTYETDDIPSNRASRPRASGGGGAAAAPVQQVQYPEPDPKFDRQVVAYETAEEPGTIIIDTANKFLYYVLEGGEAIRMGVGVGREGFGWTGTVHVGAMQENPKWFPPADMVARQPELARYQANGMDGGEGNPLGVRALYLYDDAGKDTLYRIHGTIEPNSIGLNVSSGCIRMLNENVTELYGLAKIGTKVIVT
jgi:lipoprotein-anchoring transpeptidase ErfK/SrfK